MYITNAYFNEMIVKPAMGALLFLSLKHNCRTWDGISNWPYVIHEQAIGRQYITHYLYNIYDGFSPLNVFHVSFT